MDPMDKMRGMVSVLRWTVWTWWWVERDEERVDGFG